MQAECSSYDVPCAAPECSPSRLPIPLHNSYLQRNSADNAFRLYCKTRPPAAAESVKRARTLPKASLLATLVHGTLRRVLVGLPPPLPFPACAVLHSE